jgi:CheY-like chemotaxis protein
MQTSRRPVDLFAAQAKNLIYPCLKERLRAGAGDGPQTMILVVDGFQPALEFYVEALTRAGYAVRGVSDGRAAIELLRARRYALIVCNYQMEGITGLDVLEAARRHARGTPVILVSGMPNDVMLQAAYARGAVAVLAKPVSMTDLLTTIQDALAAIPGREERAG